MSESAEELWKKALVAADKNGQRRISLEDLSAVRELATARRLVISLPLLSNESLTGAFYLILPDGTVEQKMQDPTKADEWITREVKLRKADASPN